MLRAELLHTQGRRGVIAAESRGVWRELEGRLRPYIARRVVSPHDVDDLIQEVLVRMHRGVVELDDGESFGGWVYRIAERAIIDHFRARARHPLAACDSGDSHAGASHDDSTGERESGALEAELVECLVLFVARLPSPYREAITLTEIEGLGQREAADMLGISLPCMKSRVQRGRERVRRMFEGCCELSVDVRGRVLECSPRSVARGSAACPSVALAWASRRAP